MPEYEKGPCEKDPAKIHALLCAIMAGGRNVSWAAPRNVRTDGKPHDPALILTLAAVKLARQVDWIFEDKPAAEVSQDTTELVAGATPF